MPNGSMCRSRGNRTPITGFGVRCPTIERATQKWNQRESDPHSQTASLESSHWTMAPRPEYAFQLHYCNLRHRIRAYLGNRRPQSRNRTCVSPAVEPT